MKFKKVLNLFVFLISFGLFSQSGEVIYQADIIEIKETNKQIKKDVDFDALMKNKEKLDYILVFNKNESFFKISKKLAVNKKLNLVTVVAGKGDYYTFNKIKTTIHQKIFFGKLFLIEIPQFNWTLTQESKKIGKYICYKAIATKEIDTRRGKSIRNITAWYTLQIPFNFGPKDYNGLPGLILELQEDSLLFTAAKISLFPDKKTEIVKPKKGEKVTQKEYDSIVKKNYFKT